MVARRDEGVSPKKRDPGTDGQSPKSISKCISLNSHVVSPVLFDSFLLPSRECLFNVIQEMEDQWREKRKKFSSRELISGPFDALITY